jgi:TatD DNase family protein
MNAYIDIGINLTNRQFQNDIENIVQNALDAGVSQMILTGTSVKKSQQSAQIAKNHQGILYATAGIHPHDANTFDNQSIAKLRELLEQKQVVAVGECGLDFDRDFSPRNQQEICFKAQLELAISTQKPLFLHERAAHNRFMALTNDYLPKLPKAVVHCFTGTLQDAKTYLDKGFYLGFKGAISDVNRFAHLKEVIQYVPLNRLMIETDAPFMLPKNVPKTMLTQYHERRNEPAFLPYAAGTIAQCKGISLDRVAAHSSENAKAFFGM